MKTENLQKIERTIVPPLRLSDGALTTRGASFYDPDTNRYYGYSRGIYTGPYRMSSDIPVRELIPVKE